MKILAVICLLISSNVYADNSITCDVTPSTQHESVTIQLDANKLSVNSIDYKFQVQNNDGTLADKTTRIYSRWPLTRGELTVTFCNPNDNAYHDYNDSYSLWSMCSAPSGIGQISFMADFNSKTGGKISFVKADEVTVRDLNISNCH